MRTSESLKQLAPDLAKAMKEIGHAKKDATNPHFKNDYATLESVIDATKEKLLKYNLVLVQGMNNDGSSLVTKLLHTSGEWLETDVKIVLDKQNMQGLGSAITYARRYGLTAICNMSQADDDGNAASANETRKPSKHYKGSGSVQNEF